jgi:hypothetical protein
VHSHLNFFLPKGVLLGVFNLFKRTLAGFALFDIADLTFIVLDRFAFVCIRLTLFFTLIGALHAAGLALTCPFLAPN